MRIKVSYLADVCYVEILYLFFILEVLIIIMLILTTRCGYAVVSVRRCGFCPANPVPFVGTVERAAAMLVGASQQGQAARTSPPLAHGETEPGPLPVTPYRIQVEGRDGWRGKRGSEGEGREGEREGEIGCQRERGRNRRGDRHWKC